MEGSVQGHTFQSTFTVLFKVLSEAGTELCQRKQMVNFLFNNHTKKLWE